MQLPRRVPWTTLAELDQLCSWVYRDDDRDSSRDRAIERLSAWRFMTPLPHALESLLSILVAIRQDDGNARADAAPTSSLSLRQSYATALIRLVNGLVDPLQAGTYARSILSIASQIGLPAWLVELRHAATHEDLPSLELLREGAKESLTWLLHNYFVPTLSPSVAPEQQASSAAKPAIVVRPVDPLLTRYKSLLKTVSRDTSLRARHAADISGVLREVERWLAEARVAAAAAAAHAIEPASPPTSPPSSALAAAAIGDGDDRAGDDEEEELEPREAWALERFCDALLAKGALVPVSRKKRVASKGRPHHPPSSLLAIWIPLLESVAANHAHFPTVLTSHIIMRLLSADADADAADEDDDHDAHGAHDAPTLTGTAVLAAAERASHDVCLAAWAAWLVEWRRGNAHDDDSEADVAARRQDAFFQLVQALAAVPARATARTSSNSSGRSSHPGCVRHSTTSSDRTEKKKYNRRRRATRRHFSRHLERGRGRGCGLNRGRLERGGPRCDGGA
ncbi:Las1-domain-containing protein, partial [Russula earlei]